MSAEPFDLDEAERLYRDTAAVLSELMPSAQETAERFNSARFEANVTGADDLLVRLADEAREAATCAREMGFLMETLAEGIEAHDMLLVRAAIHALRQMALREFRFASYRDDGGVQ